MRKNLMKAYEGDASGMSGDVLDVVFPNDVDEVCDVVKKNSRIVVRGGGTGLAGGCVPTGDVVMDMSKMIGISNLNLEKNSVEVEAGVVLDDLQNYLAEFGLEFPVNPSSHGVATIGGMISTDAVGSRAVKYGKTSVWVKWIDVVDCYGEVSRKGVTELMDYAGMEGITGVVVRACLKLSPIKKRSASLVGVDSVDEAVAVARVLKRDVSVSMIEFVDRRISREIGFEDKYHLIVEFEGVSRGDGGQVTDGRGRLEGEEYFALLRKRDMIGPMMSRAGNVILEDPRVLLDRMPGLIKWLEDKGVPVFGHFGYGILHPRFNEETKKFIPDMMKIVRRLGGQVSGEHGIGLLKKEFVEANDRKILINVKKRCDPLGKFGRGKIVDF